MSEFSRDKHREFGFPRDMEVLPYFLPDPGRPAMPRRVAGRRRRTRGRISSSSAG